LTPYFNKRNRFELPKHSDGTPILADQVKKNQVKAKELGLGDQTFAIDKLIFPRGKLISKGDQTSNQDSKPKPSIPAATGRRLVGNYHK